MKIGVYRKAAGMWYLDTNGNGTWEGCGTDACFAWGGDPSDIPGVGDRNGDGRMEVGVYHQATEYWYGDFWDTGIWYGCEFEICVQFGGEATDVPVIGDWSGDGAIKLGICRAATGTWYLEMNQNGVWDGCATDTCVRWGGDPMDKVVLGDWEGSGTTKIGVYRASTGTWYLDANGNGLWDGCAIDTCIAWGGNPTDQPIVGKW